MKHATQTDWLETAAHNIADLLAQIGATPEAVAMLKSATVAPGFPAKGSRHKNAHLSVAVYTPEQSPNDKAQILLDPRVTDATVALEALLYGSIMLATDHLPTNQSLTEQLALNTDYSGMTTDLLSILEAIADQLGPYPAAGLTLPPHTPQKGRMIKFVCQACDWQAYTSRKQLERIMAAAYCPCCATAGSLTVPKGKK